jgi:hypothetical protein
VTANAYIFVPDLTDGAKHATQLVGDVHYPVFVIADSAGGLVSPATEATLLAILASLTGTSGAPVNTYGEIAAVVSGVLTTIVSYTVPVGKTFYLRHATSSGENIGSFWLEVDSVKQSAKRTWHGTLSVDFHFEGDNGQGLIATAGQVVRIRALHNRGGTADFEGNLFGRLL